jgi:hypothetical protein
MVVTEGPLTRSDPDAREGIRRWRTHFKVRMDEPISLLERERYDAVTRTLGRGDLISLVHISSSTIVLEVRFDSIMDKIESQNGRVPPCHRIGSFPNDTAREVRI